MLNADRWTVKLSNINSVQYACSYCTVDTNYLFIFVYISSIMNVWPKFAETNSNQIMEIPFHWGFSILGLQIQLTINDKNCIDFLVSQIDNSQEKPRNGLRRWEISVCKSVCDMEMYFNSDGLRASNSKRATYVLIQ